MNSILEFFLRTKHWLMFLLTFGLTMVGQIAVIASMIANPLSPEAMFQKLTLVIFTATVLAMLPWFAWLWAAGSFLSSLQQAPLVSELRFFRFAIASPLPYLCVFFWVFQSSHPEWFLIILPIHFFAMFCIFYSMYFVSKNLAQAEIQRRATFQDYAGYFFLLWFYPIGIWIIQPKINRFFAARSNLA